MASTAAESITHPASPDTHTDRTIPRGTASAAPTVSSAAWAEASNPVMVYAGSSSPRANSQAVELAGKTGSPSGSPP